MSAAETAIRLYDRANAASRDALELERTDPRFARCRRQDAKALRYMARQALRP